MSDRRTEILEVAKDIFAERGVKATTVRQIGAKAGILSGSLYHHFDSKFDIVDAILQDFSEHVTAHDREIANQDESAVERLKQLIRFSFSLVTDYRAATLIIQNDTRYLLEHERFSYIRDHGQEVERIWVGVLKEGVKEGSIRSDIDPDLFYRATRDVIAGAVHWYRPSRGKSIEEISDEVTEVLLSGILSSSAQPASGQRRSTSLRRRRTTAG